MRERIVGGERNERECCGNRLLQTTCVPQRADQAVMCLIQCLIAVQRCAERTGSFVSTSIRKQVHALLAVG